MPVEAHLTLLVPRAAEAALREWLAANAMKLTHIELSQGAFPQQTMISARIQASPQEALQRANDIRSRLVTLGIAVTRTKLEMEHAPGEELGTALYLEHHVKVFTSAEGVAALRRVGAAHGARLSRNPFRAAHNGIEERFLTQRFPADAPTEAAAGLDALLKALRLGSVPVARFIRERVVYDDNLSLDAGWQPDLP